MSAKLSDEQLNRVREWAAQGVDLNGIQKNLQAECGVHLTYMEVRFLLLDHGIEIASEPAPAEQAESPQEQQQPTGPATTGKVQVSMDELQIPGTMFSGKATFPGGAHGAWQIDQLGRFGWSELTGQPSPEEMTEFQQALTSLFSRL